MSELNEKKMGPHSICTNAVNLQAYAEKRSLAIRARLMNHNSLIGSILVF